MAYLLDTNAFFEILCETAEISLPGAKGYSEKIKGKPCYISRVTLIEIISVIGKYGRGETKGWQVCNRIIGENGEKCPNRFFNPGRKKWNRKRVMGMFKLVNEVTTGKSALLRLGVLPVTEPVLQEAERFIHNAVTHKFATMDAIIVATAKIYEREHKEKMTILTADKSLLGAIRMEQREMLAD